MVYIQNHQYFVRMSEMLTGLHVCLNCICFLSSAQQVQRSLSGWSASSLRTLPTINTNVQAGFDAIHDMWRTWYVFPAQKKTSFSGNISHDDDVDRMSQGIPSKNVKWSQVKSNSLAISFTGLHDLFFCKIKKNILKTIQCNFSVMFYPRVKSRR